MEIEQPYGQRCFRARDKRFGLFTCRPGLCNRTLCNWARVATTGERMVQVARWFPNGLQRYGTAWSFYQPGRALIRRSRMAHHYLHADLGGRGGKQAENRLGSPLRCSSISTDQIDFLFCPSGIVSPRGLTVKSQTSYPVSPKLMTEKFSTPSTSKSTPFDSFFSPVTWGALFLSTNKFQIYIFKVPFRLDYWFKNGKFRFYAGMNNRL